MVSKRRFMADPDVVNKLLDVDEGLNGVVYEKSQTVMSLISGHMQAKNKILYITKSFDLIETDKGDALERSGGILSMRYIDHKSRDNYDFGLYWSADSSAWVCTLVEYDEAGREEKSFERAEFNKFREALQCFAGWAFYDCSAEIVEEIFSLVAIDVPIPVEQPRVPARPSVFGTWS